MDFLKQWTFCVCVTLVISVIFLLFTPSGRMSSFYRLVISLFIFISFLYPFSDFKPPDIDYSFAQLEFESSGEKAYEIMINNQVQSILSLNKISAARVESDVSVKNNEITVEQVTIAVADEYNEKDVEDLVFDNLGINAWVIHIGD